MGQKQKTEGKRERERKKERTKVGNTYGQLRIATPPQVAHAKPPGPKKGLNLISHTEASAAQAYLSTGVRGYS